MAEETTRSYKWVLPLLVGAVCGGLGGAVFTWYMNRPRPTTLTYNIIKTTLSAPEATGLIPDLKVLISGSQIQALYSYSIELLPRGGPQVDKINVAFSFQSPVRVYGIHQESPTDLHHLECNGMAGQTVTIPLPNPNREVTSVGCILGPVSFQDKETRPFRITIATDKNDIPHAYVVDQKLQFVSADNFAGSESGPQLWELLLLSPLIFLAGALVPAVTEKLAKAVARLLGH